MKEIILTNSDHHWRARVRINGKRKYIGAFKTELEAATAYNRVVIDNFGQNTELLNQIDNSL